jgi:hypothetical protein
MAYHKNESSPTSLPVIRYVVIFGLLFAVMFVGIPVGLYYASRYIGSAVEELKPVIAANNLVPTIQSLQSDYMRYEGYANRGGRFVALMTMWQQQPGSVLSHTENGMVALLGPPDFMVRGNNTAVFLYIFDGVTPKDSFAIVTFTEGRMSIQWSTRAAYRAAHADQAAQMQPYAPPTRPTTTKTSP